jgi:hypothetical protein
MVISDQTRVRRTILFTVAFVFLPLGAIALLLCVDSYAAWLQFRLAADEYVSPQLEWIRAALTGSPWRAMS